MVHTAPSISWMFSIFMFVCVICALQAVVAVAPDAQQQNMLAARFAAAHKADPKKLAEELVNKAAW